MFYKDTPGEFDDADPTAAGKNLGLKQRYERVKEDRILDADDFTPKKKAKKFDLNLSEELENKNVQIPNYSVYLSKNTAIELFGNINDYIWLESQMRGGICLVSKRYARANNPSLSSIYDPSKPHSYILALDIVNLYGYAMSQFLPYVCGDFCWLSLEEINNSDILTIPQNNNKGFILEFDLEFPESEHERETD
ncbi:uncharacterized protein TNCV_735181 [Trichonephila clavipes]|uniref:DNA-directed DNA polymerase n=1 Tax=Trichonephila clavipes TaxID=2585209 RepID=A0A8X6VKQ8_TRICX|nr:uncharacterized protein TNCV_735181 [Trichonephila clavipes]